MGYRRENMRISLCLRLWLASLFIQMILPSAISGMMSESSISGGAVYGDSTSDIDLPIFQDTPEHFILPDNVKGSERGPSNSEPEPLELMSDTRPEFISWEFNANGGVEGVVPQDYDTRGTEIHDHESTVSYSNNRGNYAGEEDFQDPPLQVQKLIEDTLKRPDVALTPEDLKVKKNSELYQKKVMKRNHLLTPHHFSCEFIQTWNDLGLDHFPRHVKVGSCASSRCANGLYQCVPKTFNLKILKKYAPSDSLSYEAPNTLLPPSLRDDWRIVEKEIIHCCECSGQPISFSYHTK